MTDYVVSVDSNDVVELLDLVDVTLMPYIIGIASQRTSVRLPGEPVYSDKYRWVLLREVEDIIIFNYDTSMQAV